MKFWNLKSGYDMLVIPISDFRLISGEEISSVHSKCRFSERCII